MPFLDHLAELRTRMIIVLCTGILAFALGLYAAPAALGWLMKPLIAAMHDQDRNRQATLVLGIGADGTVVPAIRPPGSSTGLPVTTETLSLAAGARIAVGLRDGQPVEIAASSGRAGNVFFLSPIEPIMLILKTAAILGVILTVPMAAYQAWLFIAPGLLSRERRILGWTLGAMVVLFPLGAGFAYLISRVMLAVLIGFSTAIPGLEPSIVAGKGLGFILTMMVVFGIVFEFPLVLVLLSRLGVVSAAFLVRWRRTAIVLMAIAAAVLTPSPDPFSMLALLLPVLLLYEASILVIRSLDAHAPARGRPSPIAEKWY